MELTLSLKQKQILSQRMQLSVKILQMNAMDLDHYIKEAALENPLIELDLPPQVEDPSVARLKKLEWLDRMDESNSYRHVLKAEEEKETPLYQNNPSDCLYDVLISQVPGFHLSVQQERIVRYLISDLDDNGYLTSAHHELQATLDITEDALTQALNILFKMDPPGVGAANLKECLLIQANRLVEPNHLLIQLIQNHLDLIAKNRLDKLAKILKVSLEEVKQARDLLLTCNPKPGNGYSSYQSIPYIRPDLFIVHFEDAFQVILNDYNQPKIELNRYYRSLAEEDTAMEAASYIRERLHKAEWLISCIQQRKSTILKCAGSILQQQHRFFTDGPGHLVPMTLANVAADINMHPSTVSRATQGKYLQCQWGIFGLSEFFSRSVSHTTENQTQDTAMSQIRRIIAEEDAEKPFSDQAICDQLKKHGIDIARRTIAKYREQMGIPPACGRKTYE